MHKSKKKHIAWKTLRYGTMSHISFYRVLMSRSDLHKNLWSRKIQSKHIQRTGRTAGAAWTWSFCSACSQLLQTGALQILYILSTWWSRCWSWCCSGLRHLIWRNPNVRKAMQTEQTSKNFKTCEDGIAGTTWPICKQTAQHNVQIIKISSNHIKPYQTISNHIKPYQTIRKQKKNDQLPLESLPWPWPCVCLRQRNLPERSPTCSSWPILSALSTRHPLVTSLSSTYCASAHAMKNKQKTIKNKHNMFLGLRLAQSGDQDPKKMPRSRSCCTRCARLCLAHPDEEKWPPSEKRTRSDKVSIYQCGWGSQRGQTSGVFARNSYESL